MLVGRVDVGSVGFILVDLIVGMLVLFFCFGWVSWVGCFCWGFSGGSFGLPLVFHVEFLAA